MRSLLLLLAVSSVAFAAPPIVPSKMAVKKLELARIEIEVPKDKVLSYKSTGSDEKLYVDELVPRNGKTRIQLQGKEDGTYYIAFVIDGEISFTEIVVGTGKIEDEKEKPKPQPSNQKVKAYLITESADKNIKYTFMLQSKTIQDYWKSRNFGSIVIADPNTVDPATGKTPERLKPYIKQASGLPDQLYLVDISTGDVLFEGNAPQDEAKLLEILRNIK